MIKKFISATLVNKYGVVKS